MPFTNMKPIFSFVFIVSLLLLGSSVSYARKDLEAFWEKRMKGLPIPELIKDLVAKNQPSVSEAEEDRFVRDFDIRPNVIIYHSHVASKEMTKKKPFVKNLEAEDFKEEQNSAQKAIEKD